jgi:hypothetical protein
LIKLFCGVKRLDEPPPAPPNWRPLRFTHHQPSNMDIIEINATDGDHCYSQEHRFRIGNEVPDAVEFVADNRTFADRLDDARILKHSSAPCRAFL